MRAVLLHGYGPPDGLRLGELPAPSVGPDDVLIDVHATSVNPVDAKIRAGFQRAAIHLRLPAILGMDVSGIVMGVGEKVTGFAVGDEVFASPSHRRMGCYAEQVAVRAAEVAPKPRTIEHHAAASLPLVALTAWDALVRRGKLRSGQRVLIQAGAGGVGSIAIQLARHLGAEVSTTCSPRNAELVRSLGAHRAIDHTTENYEEIARDVDLVIDCFAGDHLERALRTVRRGGRIVGLSTNLPEQAKRRGPWLGAASAFAQLAGFITRARLTRGVRFTPMARKPDGSALAQIAELVDEGVIRPLIDRVLPLDDAAEAHRLIESGRTRGKLVLATR